MRSYEKELIAKAISTGGAETLIAQGVQPRHFSNEECSQIWEHVIAHIRDYKSPPEPATVKEDFPDFKWVASTEPLKFIADRFIAQAKRRKAVTVFEEMAEILDKDEFEDLFHIDEIFVEKARELSQELPSTNATKFSSAKGRIDMYRQKKEAGDPLGLSYGIDELDKWTMGLFPHQYVTIAGFTGVGKSTLGMQLAVNHYLEGANVMIVSLEMDEDEVHRKLDGIASTLRQQALKELQLNGVEMERWEEMAERAEKAANDIIVVDVDFATPEKVYGDTARWNPDVVIVDYVQLMLAPKHLRAQWEKVDHCSRMLKAQARAMKIPVYGIAQTNADAAEEGAKLTNLGGSKSIGFHSDLVLGLRQTDDDLAQKQMQVTIEKNRGGPKNKTITMHWDQEKSEFRQWNERLDGFNRSEAV